MYSDLYSDGIINKLVRIKKKDPSHYSIIKKKIDQIIANPERSYKFLHYSMQGINRVHIGHFVLIFVINHKNKTISFEDYDLHDKIYY